MADVSPPTTAHLKPDPRGSRDLAAGLARSEASELILGLTQRALEAPDLASAVVPTLQELLERTAAAGSAYFQTGAAQHAGAAPAYHARASAGELPQGEAMTAILAHGLPGDTPLMRALQSSQRPLFFDDTAAAPEAAGFPGLGVCSLAAAPVCGRGGQLVGAFLMHTFVPHAWTTPEAQFFTAVAGTLAQLTARLAAEEDAQTTREAALRALGLGLEYKDRETHGHTDRVTELALAIGIRLGLAAPELQALRWGAYLHDIGKLAVPDAVLLKPGRLDPAEWATMQSHVSEGERFADVLGFLPPATRSVISAHHERWDGSGYPQGLSGAAIPLVARIFALCDVYDALTSQRPYKHAWSPVEAQAEILAQTGRQFDPQITQIFLDLLAQASPD